MQRPLPSNGLAGSADLIAAAIVTISSAHAEYLGNYGNLWPIDEEHAVEQTINKLKEMERTGELKERMDRYKADVIDSIENPDPCLASRPSRFREPICLIRALRCRRTSWMTPGS